MQPLSIILSIIHVLKFAMLHWCEEALYLRLSHTLHFLVYSNYSGLCKSRLVRLPQGPSLTVFSQRQSHSANLKNILYYWRFYNFFIEPHICNMTTTEVVWHFRSPFDNHTAFVVYYWYGHSYDWLRTCTLAIIYQHFAHALFATMHSSMLQEF